MHEIPLITTIALALSAALPCGYVAKRLGLSPIVGYLIAGVLIGPHTPGVVGDTNIASQLAEIGIILLMFGVGLHFSLKELLAVRSIALPGALGQITISTAVCTGLAVALGWSWQAALLLGIAVSVASTVVLLRGLIEQGVLNSPEGHAVVGWLIVQDIITVLVLVLLPPLAGNHDNPAGIWQTIGFAVLKLLVLTGIMALAGARFVPWLLLRVARARSRELFTLSVLVIAICVATVSYVTFGASMALGAFLGGMVVGQSKVSDQAAADVLPMRDAFAVLFFVAVGMLFNFKVLVEAPLLVLSALAVILVVTPLVAFGIVILGGHSLRIGLTVAGGLMQIGEFSFILGDMGRSLGVFPSTGSNVLVGAAIISISLNPLLFRGVLALEPILARRPRLARWLMSKREKLGAQANEIAAQRIQDPGAIVIGYGPVGQTVTRLLSEFEINPVIIETNVDVVLELHNRGKHALFGDATRPEILRAANLEAAAYLIVTVPDADISVRIIQVAREVAPLIRVLARAEYINQAEAFRQAGAAIVRYDEAESAAALAEALLQDIDVPTDRIDALVIGIRNELALSRAHRKLES
jgi:CPA2 family monovalent cation:H+ antiporter-2